MSSPSKFSPTKSSPVKKENNVGKAEFVVPSLKAPTRKQPSKNVGMNGGEEQQPSMKKRKVEDRDLWKLAKGKYMLGFYLCVDDWNKLYNNKQRVLRKDDGRFAVNFELCEECALANVRATDILAPPKAKKRIE